MTFCPTSALDGAETVPCSFSCEVMVFPLLPSILPSALFNFPIAAFFVSSAFAESFVVTPLSRAVILSLTPPTV